MGLNSVVVCSDGMSVSNPKFYRKAEKKLKLRHQQMDRNIKGLKNRNKARIRLKKAYIEVANARKDFLLKLFSLITKMECNCTCQNNSNRHGWQNQ
jgi:putative transposase